MAHPFLSDEWIAEARAIRAEYEDPETAVDHPVRMNLVVTEIPFQAHDLHAHLDSTGGGLEVDKGHVEAADLTVTIDYLTAKAILVDQDPQAALQAFMAGKVRVDGDMAKLMGFQVAPPGGQADEMRERLRAITA